MSWENKHAFKVGTKEPSGIPDPVPHMNWGKIVDLWIGTFSGEPNDAGLTGEDE